MKSGAVLDPRFKKGWMKRSGYTETDIITAVKRQISQRYRNYRKLCANIYPSSHSVKKLFPCLIGECCHLVTDQNSADEETTGAPEAESDGPRRVQGSRKRKNSESLLYSSVLEEPRSQSVGPETILDEFETYINEPNVPMEQPTNPLDPESKMEKTRPLQFWKANSHRFPFLSIVARDSLAVPASSGSIERSYSTSTDILCAKRNRTKPDLFSNLMFIKCNAKVSAATIKL